MRATPPHNVEAEESLVGALMLDPASWRRVAGTVAADDCFCADSRLILSAIAALQEQGQHADVVCVIAYRRWNTE